MDTLKITLIWLLVFISAFIIINMIVGVFNSIFNRNVKKTIEPKLIASVKPDAVIKNTSKPKNTKVIITKPKNKKL